MEHANRRRALEGQRECAVQGGLVVLFVVMAMHPLLCAAQNLYQCESDLAQLERDARKASAEASGANGDRTQLEQALADLKRCADFPSTFDIMSDGCRGRQRTAEAAAQQLQSAEASLDYALAAVARSVGAASLSCGKSLSNSEPISGYGSSERAANPGIPSLSGKQLGALLAVGAIGALVASRVGAEDEAKRLGPAEIAAAPMVPPELPKVTMEVVSDGSSIGNLPTGDIPSMTTVGRSELGKERIGRLSELAVTTPDSVEGFRWGKSVGPKGSVSYGTTWYTTLLANGRTVTLYAEPGGLITHRILTEGRRSPQ